MKSNLRMPDGSGVVAIVGELVAAGMAQHVAVNEEGEAGGFASPRDHALSAIFHAGQGSDAEL